MAIKVIPAALASDPEHLARFETEARAASALNHPNLITIHEVGREGSVVYLVMELVEGETLRAHLASGPLPLRKALVLAEQAAEGLARAHAAGMAAPSPLPPIATAASGSGCGRSREEERSR